MSFDLPASVERDLERYAQDEHITPAEAVAKLVQNALKDRESKPQPIATGPLTEEEWAKLRVDPTFIFFSRFSESEIDEMEAASRDLRGISRD